MSHEHKHGHGHHHDHEHEHEHAGPAGAPAPRANEMDTAGRSLSEALRISFAILKVIMIVLVVGFLASGFRTIESGEKGIVLQFGRVHKTVPNAGWLWVLPYPIQELIRIPTDRRITMPVNTFWYKETREDILGQGVIPRNYFEEKLNPLQEGYSLTQSERRDSETALSQSDASDYSIVHTKWQIDYRIDGIDQFYRNVYVPETRPGQVYFDVVTQSITPMLRSVVEDAIVNAMVHCTIDEALQSIDTIPRRVQQFVQEKLRSIDSGVSVTSVRLVVVEWPKQVNESFQESITASQKKQEAITQAKTYAQNTMNEVAGRVAGELFEALLNPQDAEVTPEVRERLWSQVSGQAGDRIAQARAYKTKVVETAKANADYLMNLLPEYRKRPALVAQAIYLAVMEEVLTTADEKFIVEPSRDSKDHEIRILVNRDKAKTKPQATK